MRTKPWEANGTGTAQELISASVIAFFIMVGGVAPAKGDLVVGERDQAMIGDGHAMGVAAEILEHVFGSTEGRLAVNHPMACERVVEPGGEDLGMSEPRQIAVKVQLPVSGRPA